ncbi:uncharacterized protein [Haliotis cracherodii]|uniref:uncharacterized protein n=1 Tax=Haliotis cracherodii TaxID=6455 RepID=UPI0039EA03E1
MATSQKLTEHFLTCTICTEVFDNPCTLVCNHTFCRKCVVNYTKTRPEAISAKSLLCPFCNKMTKVSAPERPVEEWADDVKPIFIIQGLLDSFGPGSKDTASCSYCREEGETTPAVVWCSVCDEALCDKCTGAHNRIPSLRKHKVIDLSGEVKVRRRNKVTCKEHKDETIKYLCKDCKKAVCQTCCTIYHRKCDSVVTLESEMMAVKAELVKMKETLSRRRHKRNTEVQKMKSVMSEEICRHSQKESDIQSASLKAIQRIKLKEQKLLDQLREMSEKHIGQLKADIKSGEMSVQMYQQQAELIDQALQSECDMDVYEMYQGCEAGDVEAVGVADVKERGRISKVTFRQDTDKLSKSLDDLQLGEIDVMYESVLDLTATPVLQDTINVKVAGDSNTPYSTDVTVMVVNDTDTVVVTDNYNHSVKSFYTRNNQTRHIKLSLGDQPLSVTKLTHNQVAVTVLNMNQIVTVEVNPDLVLLSTVTTSKQYWGITSLTPSTLAAGSRSPPCVDILDMTGNVLRSISPLQNGNNILRYPNFLCTTRTGNILVSDTGTKCVVCLTPEGDVVFTYSPTGDTALKYPHGITSTSTGDILVTDYSIHRVIHLTESGQFVRNILTQQDGINHPVGMATSQKLTEHFLTCTICTEVFDNPCTLVCNHTFCRKCIVIYTKTRPEAISAKSLLCPFCNKMTKVSAPERPVEDWADDVKPMFVIQGLLDSFGPGCKDATNCSYCKEEGETTPAVVWCSVCDDALCEQCARIHKRNPSSRHHDDLSGEVKVKRKRKVMCREHKEQCIELLCEDCKLAACHKCCTLHHRKCNSVVTIESKIPAMKTKLTKTKEDFLKQRNRIETEMQKQKLKVDEEPVRYTEIVSSITTTSKKALEQIKVKERKLQVELREMSDKHIKQLKSDIKSGEMSVQMYQQQAELIDQALQSECYMDVYEMYHGCESGDVEAVRDADVEERGRISKVTFRQDMDKLSKSLEDLQLGEIDVLYEGVLDLTATPVLHDTIDVRVAGDSNTSYPTAVTVMVVNDTDTVVVTDWNNNSVKSFYTRDNQTRHSKLSLGGQPWGLTKLTQNQVAVTVLNMNQIVTVEVNPDLVLLSTIKTSKQYWSITSLTPSTLAAGSRSPPCVDILDMTGRVLKSISPRHDGNIILEQPSLLCTTRTGNILVSDGGTECVVCLTPEGDVVFTYSLARDTAMKGQRGITSTSTGDILVTDYSLHRVIHLTESGQFVRNIHTSCYITLPGGICVNGRDRVYITYNQGVYVFRFDDSIWARLASSCTIL